jgi:hypothetical protein
MRRAFLAAVLGCAVSAPTMAALVYSTGFESGEGYSTGNLVPQNSWDRADQPTQTPAVTVQNSVAASGSQAVQFTTSGTAGGSSFIFHPDVYDAITNGNPLVTISWDMRVNASATPTQAWALEAYDSSGGPNLIAGAGAAGAALVASNAAGTGFDDVGNVGSQGVFHNYKLTLDFASSIYALDLDGTRKYYGQFATGNNGILGEVDLVANDRGSDTAYFDNISINATTGSVPEPATLGLIGVAGAMLLGRRRRQA